MDIERFIRLLQEEQNLRNQNTSLLFKKPEEFVTLISDAEDVAPYLHTQSDFMVKAHYHWSSKNEYLELMQELLNFNIDGHQFCSQFLEMYSRLNQKSWMLDQDAEKGLEWLKSIEPNEESDKFNTLLGGIWQICYLFINPNAVNVTVTRPTKIIKTEEELRDAVRTLFPDIQ